MQDPLKPLKILWMIPKWTLPATDGARVATDSLIRNTIGAGAIVDVMCLSQKTEPTDPEMMMKAWNVKKVVVVPRSLPDTSLAKKFYYLSKLLLNPLTPLTFSSFSDRKVQRQVSQYIQKIVMILSFWMACIWEPLF